MSRTRVVRDVVEHGVSACDFCGARIVWALTDSERPTPVDAEPSPQGLWVLYHYAEEEPTPRQRVAYAPLTGYGELYRGPRWRSHWGTCPHRELAKRAHLARLAGPSPQLELFGSKGGR